MASDKRYGIFTLRAWTKEGLAEKAQEALEPFPREAIVSIRMGADTPWVPLYWRRNWAHIVVERPEAPPG